MSIATTPPRIFVTGMGAVTPCGQTVDRFWESLLRSESGLSALDRFDLGGIACVTGGQIRHYTPPVPPHPLPALDLATGFALGACAEAIAQAGGSTENLGLITASNFGALDEGERALAGECSDEALAACAQDATTRRLVAAWALTGPTATLSLSCAAGAAALAQAASMLRTGRAERLLVVGYDALSRCAWSGLCSLRTMTRDCIRPFDLNRSGTLFSEGAGALLLEREESCRSHNRQPLAELRGWATNNNGFHMTAPPARAAGSAQVMRQAIAQAGLQPDDVDHINAHGTGTKPNDLTEAQAFADVFGARLPSIPVTAIKATTGHLLGAAGSIEAIASILALRHGLIPPTLNFETPDPAAPIDLVVGSPRQVALQCVLSNSAGFGGCNAAVLFTPA